MTKTLGNTHRYKNIRRTQHITTCFSATNNPPWQNVCEDFLKIGSKPETKWNKMNQNDRNLCPVHSHCPCFYLHTMSENWIHLGINVFQTRVADSCTHSNSFLNLAQHDTQKKRNKWVQTWRLEIVENHFASQTLGLTPKWTKQEVGMSSDVTGWGLTISAICHIGKHNDNCRQRGNANADNQLSSVWRVHTPTNMGSSSNLSSPRRLARTRIAPKALNAPVNGFGFIKCFGPDLEHGRPKNILSTYPPFYNTYPYLFMSVFIPMPISIYREMTLCNYCKEHGQSTIL